MTDGYAVDVEQIRGHAANIEALKARFEAVKAASSHISGDDQAYGLLCGWISGVLEGRHVQQDEVVAYVEENLALAAESLRQTAAEYEAVEAEQATSFSRIEGGPR
ncbi:type VII secretion target [Actinosynnema sp. CS-041913]|uniref:type VII secretion target n=1 Tax=Actinosynnema sp. CS-041913 TaxID=3239917 RepID=UPI003D924916